MKVQVRKIGNSVGIIIPKENLDRLHLKSGDKLSLIEGDGGIRLLPLSDDLATQLEAAREGMEQYRAALRELAK